MKGNTKVGYWRCYTIEGRGRHRVRTWIRRGQERILWLRVLFLSGMLLAFLIPLPSPALEVGSVFGPGVEWIGGSDWKDDLSNSGMSTDHSTDFLYGLFLRVPLFQWGSTTFQLRPEVQLMSPRGSGSSATAEMDVFSKVLHFPLSFEAWYPLGFGAVYGFAGPSLNLFLTEIDWEMESPSGLEKGSSTPYYGVVVGALLGGGYAFPFPAFSVQFEARYTHTISLILKDKDTSFRGFYLLLGVYFPVRWE